MKLIFSIIQPQRDFCKRLKSFSAGRSIIIPLTPLEKGGNYKEFC